MPVLAKQFAEAGKVTAKPNTCQGRKECNKYDLPAASCF
jgi:hypothetical protein